MKNLFSSFGYVGKKNKSQNIKKIRFGEEKEGFSGKVKSNQPAV